jgi:hypothetical protein
LRWLDDKQICAAASLRCRRESSNPEFSGTVRQAEQQFGRADFPKRDWSIKKQMVASLKSAITGAALSGLLLGTTVRTHAQTSEQSDNSKNNDSSKASSQDKHVKEKHACKGQNSCKGKGGCKTSDNGCKGENSCKGKGGCRTDGKKASEQK